MTWASKVLGYFHKTYTTSPARAGMLLVGLTASEIVPDRITQSGKGHNKTNKRKIILTVIHFSVLSKDSKNNPLWSRLRVGSPGSAQQKSANGTPKQSQTLGVRWWQNRGVRVKKTKSLTDSKISQSIDLVLRFCRVTIVVVGIRKDQIVLLKRPI